MTSATPPTQGTPGSPNTPGSPGSPGNTDLPPQYDPTQVEPAVLERYLASKAYAPAPGSGSASEAAPPYCIVIPPPNVTAALHLGHALNNTLQDILTRVHRMRGFNTLWMPGTDHAGIATQTVVDKRLQAEGKKALKDYKAQENASGEGRGLFIEQVQAWKDEYEGVITHQLKQMGCSCDWDRQRFTMDDQCAKAVRKAFFQLFKDELIYRGKRLVNWDPATQTALADDEVEMQALDGNFYYMKYPVCDAQGNETGEFATVATTRPETMLGDTAVAVNPNDAPRAQYIGQFVKLPIVHRVIPIIGDDYVVIPDPDSDDAKAKMASGFLKVTPAHDPNDYEIGARHDLPIINVMAPDASISIHHGWPAEENPDDNETLKPFLGLTREEARKQIVIWFKGQGLMQEVRPYRHAVGHSYRSHVPVEPYYTDQWYVKVTDDRLAGAALEAMDASQFDPGESAEPPRRQDAKGGSESEEGLKFYPERYAKTFQTWHENIRDWCISRQLWWGHRIPVWSGPIDCIKAGQDQYSYWLDQGVIAERVEGDTAFVCVDTNAEMDGVIEVLERRGLVQDPDVLDTWFSSALWPLSTLGWPDDTDELKIWNPTSVLCTAREIITLWVSRMVMFNRYFKGGDLPFNDVFIHAMIQDGHGQKMSKSLGNGVDPMDIIHSHGADAMRFTLTKMTTQTQDVRLPVDMVDPKTGETFSPQYITNKAGYKVAAPMQERNGSKMVSSYGVASGEVKTSAELPGARNTSEKFDEGQRFANKLWNALRFALPLLSGDADRPGHDDAAPGLADKWILHRLAKTMETVDQALAEYRFSDYATALYDFVWRDLCDWYVEIVKPTVKGNPTQQRVLASCLDASLRLLHPAMPFITERLWEALRGATGGRRVEGIALPDSELLIHAAWPVAEAALHDDQAEQDFEQLRTIIEAIRNARNAYKIPPRQEVEATTQAPAPVAQLLFDNRAITLPLTRCIGRGVGPQTDRPQGAAAVIVGDVTIYLHDVVDVGVERERLTKALADKDKAVKMLEGRLSNKKYVDNAPAHLVQETRDQHAAATAERDAVQQQLDALV